MLFLDRDSYEGLDDCEWCFHASFMCMYAAFMLPHKSVCCVCVSSRCGYAKQNHCRETKVCYMYLMAYCLARKALFSSTVLEITLNPCEHAFGLFAIWTDFNACLIQEGALKIKYMYNAIH